MRWRASILFLDRPCPSVWVVNTQNLNFDEFYSRWRFLNCACFSPRCFWCSHPLTALPKMWLQTVSQTLTIPEISRFSIITLYVFTITLKKNFLLQQLIPWVCTGAFQSTGQDRPRWDAVTNLKTRAGLVLNQTQLLHWEHCGSADFGEQGCLCTDW